MSRAEHDQYSARLVCNPAFQWADPLIDWKIRNALNDSGLTSRDLRKQIAPVNPLH